MNVHNRAFLQPPTAGQYRRIAPLEMPFRDEEISRGATLVPSSKKDHQEHRLSGMQCSFWPGCLSSSVMPGWKELACGRFAADQVHRECGWCRAALEQSGTTPVQTGPPHSKMPKREVLPKAPRPRLPSTRRGPNRLSSTSTTPNIGHSALRYRNHPSGEPPSGLPRPGLAHAPPCRANDARRAPAPARPGAGVSDLSAMAASYPGNLKGQAATDRDTIGAVLRRCASLQPTLTISFPHRHIRARGPGRAID